MDTTEQDDTNNRTSSNLETPSGLTTESMPETNPTCETTDQTLANLVTQLEIPDNTEANVVEGVKEGGETESVPELLAITSAEIENIPEALPVTSLEVENITEALPVTSAEVPAETSIASPQVIDNVNKEKDIDDLGSVLAISARTSSEEIAESSTAVEVDNAADVTKDPGIVESNISAEKTDINSTAVSRANTDTETSMDVEEVIESESSPQTNDEDITSNDDVQKDKESNADRVDAVPIGNMDVDINKKMSVNEKNSPTEAIPSTSDKITELDSSNMDTDDDNAIDSTEFVNADKESSDKIDPMPPQESDPIASESSSNVALDMKSTETAETIVSDSKHDDSEKNNLTPGDNSQLYILTKTSDDSLRVCMECGQNATPMYKCSFASNTLFICAENCLKTLKEKHAEKVIVRDLRVKVFASEGLRSSLPRTPVEELSADPTSPKCGECRSPVGSASISWNTFNFCKENCLSAYQRKTGVQCVECKSDICASILGRYSVRFGKDIKQFCKNACLLDHKKGQRFCIFCQGEVKQSEEYRGYCSKRCSEVHNRATNKVTQPCSVCAQEKEMEVEYCGQYSTAKFCSEPCFVAYKFVNKVEASPCDFCKVYKTLTEPIVFYQEGTKRTLCSEDCRKLYIISARRIIHCAWCNVKKYNFDMIQIEQNKVFNALCSLNCYSLYKSGCDFCHKDSKPLFHITTSEGKVCNFCSSACLSLYKDGMTESEKEENPTEAGGEANTNGESIPMPPLQPILKPVKKIVVVKPRAVPTQRNMTTMCKPYQITKSINCKPKESSKGCQTDPYGNKFLLPVPVPIYVPAPVAMFSLPVPCPVPFPLPIPVPIFIPTTRKSIKGIVKEMNKIKNKIPADPLEAELLMMADMVAEKKKEETDSESDDEPIAKELSYHSEPEQMDTNNSFGDDVLQMALKMASDFEEPVDLEGAVSASTISAGTSEDSAQRIGNIMETKRKNIRQGRQRKRKSSQTQQPQIYGSLVTPSDGDKPDANMCLKYTFGVNAWKQWVATKNIELQKTSKNPKLFKHEILQLTADELNYSLCLFVKEVRKPNGTEYAPDTIYYLCLGVQQYLYENGRIDNIFCDTFYEKFTDCLNEVCQRFSMLYNESQYIVTRVEEEHLWESKQLGAHSPLVLLNTLMFFNTKHFSLTTVPEHLQLSFSHIMKHWKRNPNQAGARNVLLRFYLPQSAEGPKKKKVYEQQENEENPLRCPVKLYGFYLSKCPESVKTRNDVFYLQPERSCVPDSPVWYSTMALGTEPLEKMLNRVKMVKEINVAILTT